ncbi:hypothetical protein GGI43DRAFT_166168 [Trichoderma evansii]
MRCDLACTPSTVHTVCRLQCTVQHPRPARKQRRLSVCWLHPGAGFQRRALGIWLSGRRLGRLLCPVSPKEAAPSHVLVSANHVSMRVGVLWMRGRSAGWLSPQSSLSSRRSGGRPAQTARTVSGLGALETSTEWNGHHLLIAASPAPGWTVTVLPPPPSLHRAATNWRHGLGLKFSSPHLRSQVQASSSLWTRAALPLARLNGRAAGRWRRGWLGTFLMPARLFTRLEYPHLRISCHLSISVPTLGAGAVHAKPLISQPWSLLFPVLPGVRPAAGCVVHAHDSITIR